MIYEGVDRWNSPYLYHHGIKGMKWGVRRYQNEDGSLTSAGQRHLYKKVKRLRKSFNRQRELVKKYVNANDLNAVRTSLTNYQNEVKKNAKQTVKFETQVDELANKYAKELYDKEIKRNGSSYPTEKDKDRLFDTFKYDYGAYERAEKEVRKLNPKTSAALRREDNLYSEYDNDLKRIINGIVGKYGDVSVYDAMKLQNRRSYKYLVEDVIDEMVKN